jgi:hypothetical protein
MCLAAPHTARALHLQVLDANQKAVLPHVSWASPELFGAAVVEFISAQEKEVVEGVQRNFQQARPPPVRPPSSATAPPDLQSQAEESFKGLRRKLPKTKQEFNWQVRCICRHISNRVAFVGIS